MMTAKSATRQRSRIHCGLIVLLLIALGLATRKFEWVPDFIGAHAGDALWAAMVYWGIALIFPKLTIRMLVITALAFSFGIEFSQLVQHPLLVKLRHTGLGALVLGHGFLGIDLVRYSVGISLAALLDTRLHDTGGAVERS
jgi:hypothetical protein